MKKYEKYKPSAYDWLSDIPTHWQELFIQQVSREQKNKNENNIVNLVLSLSYGNIIRKKNVDAGLVAKDLSTYQIVDKNNIILRFTDLQNDHKSLRTGLVKERGIISSAYTCIVPNINAAYLHYVLHSYDTQKVFYGMGGGVRQSIGYDDIRHMFVPVPTAVEQDQIVRYLDRQVSKINHLIHGYQKQIELLEERKKTLVDDAVIKGIDNSINLVQSGHEIIGDIPSHWKVQKLRTLLKVVSIKNHPKEQLLSVVREKGIIVRNTESKEDNHNYIPEDLSGYKFVECGDFVINKMKAWQGSYGVSKYTGIVSPAYYVFKLSFAYPDFFHYAIRSKRYVQFFANASDGIRVGQWDLSMDRMKEIPFIVPPEAEQKQIVEYILKESTKIDRAIPALQKEIELLREYRTRLIYDVVTGQIDVRDVVIPEYTPEEDIEINTDEDAEEVAEDAE